jgi:hypothetical protein
VGQHEPDVNDLRAIVDFSDEAVFVSTDIEHRASANRVGVRKIRSGFGQVVPVSVSGDLPPILQRLLRIRVFFPEFPQRPLADDMQRGNPLRSLCSLIESA